MKIMKFAILGLASFFVFSCSNTNSNNPSSSSSSEIEGLLSKQQGYATKKQMDSVLILGIQIRQLAEKEGDSLAMAKSLLPIKGEVDVANQRKLEVYLPGAIQYFKNHKRLYDQAKLQASYGAILATKGSYELALKELLSSYDILVKLDSLGPRFSVVLNIGNTFSGIGSHEKALLYYQKSKDLAIQLNDSLKMSSAFLDLGIEYKTSLPDSAIWYITKSAEFIPQSYRSFLALKVDYNMAQALAVQGKNVEAMAIFNRILAESTKRNETEGMAMAHRGLSTVYATMKNYPQAKFHLEQSNKIFTEIGGQDFLILEGFPEAIKLFETFGDYKNAFTYMRDYKVKNDSLVSLRKQTTIHDLEIKYQTEKKELENKSLKDQVFLERIALAVLAAFFGALLYFYLARARLLKERNAAYLVLIEKYNQSRAILQRKSSNQDELLLGKLTEYVVNRKAFLNAKLKVDEVAEAIQSSQKEIAAVLKKQKNQNFNNYINQFRVEEVIRLFNDLANDHYKLEVLAGMAGFGSKQSFYSAFELIVGVKPAFYRQNIVDKLKANNP
jgi:tetratricopeptide (TPR) repeat protein/AraC-like DNA-binding protein